MSSSGQLPSVRFSRNQRSSTDRAPPLADALVATAEIATHARDDEALIAAG
jgi:hypothetical protein